MPNWTSYILGWDLDSGGSRAWLSGPNGHAVVNSKHLESTCNFCTKLPSCWRLYPKIALKFEVRVGELKCECKKKSFPERVHVGVGKKFTIVAKQPGKKKTSFFFRAKKLCEEKKRSLNAHNNSNEQTLFDSPIKNKMSYLFFSPALYLGPSVFTSTRKISLCWKESFPFFSSLFKLHFLNRTKYAQSRHVEKKASKSERFFPLQPGKVHFSNQANTVEQINRKITKQRVNCVSLFYSKELLCWRSDLSFLNLKQYFANILKVLHICRAASRNNQRILFIGGSKSEICGIMVDSVLVKQFKRRMVPDILSGVQELRGPKKLWTQIFSLKKGENVPRSLPKGRSTLKNQVAKDHFVALNEQKGCEKNLRFATSPVAQKVKCYSTAMLSQSDFMPDKTQEEKSKGKKKLCFFELNSVRGTYGVGVLRRTNKPIFSHLVNFLNVTRDIQNNGVLRRGLLFNCKKVEHFNSKYKNVSEWSTRASAHALQLGSTKKTMADGFETKFLPTTTKVNTHKPSGSSQKPLPAKAGNLTPNTRPKKKQSFFLTQRFYISQGNTIDNNHKFKSWGLWFAQATSSPLAFNFDLHKNKVRDGLVCAVNKKKMQGKAAQIASRLPAFGFTPSMPGFLSNAKVGLQTVFQYLKSNFINSHKYAPSCLIKYNLKLQYVCTWFKQRRSRMIKKSHSYGKTSNKFGAAHIRSANMVRKSVDRQALFLPVEKPHVSKKSHFFCTRVCVKKNEADLRRVHNSFQTEFYNKYDPAQVGALEKSSAFLTRKKDPQRYHRGNVITRCGDVNNIKIGIDQCKKKIAKQTSALLNAHFLYCDVFSFNLRAAALSNILFSETEKIGGEELFGQKNNSIPENTLSLLFSQSRKSTRAARCTVRKVHTFMPSRTSRKKAKLFFEYTAPTQYAKSPSEENTRRLSGSFNDFFLWGPASALEKIKYFLPPTKRTPKHGTVVIPSLPVKSYGSKFFFHITSNPKQQKYSLQFQDLKSPHPDSPSRKTDWSVAAWSVKIGFRVKKPIFFAKSRYAPTYLGKSFYCGQTSTDLVQLEKTKFFQTAYRFHTKKKYHCTQDALKYGKKALLFTPEGRHASNICLNSNPCWRTLFPEEICYSQRFYGYKPLLGRLPVHFKQYAHSNIAYTKQGEQRQKIYFKKNIKYRNLRLFKNKNKISFYCSLSEGQKLKFSFASYGNENAINRFQSRFDGGGYAFIRESYEKKKALSKAFFRAPTPTSSSLKASLFCAVASRRNAKLAKFFDGRHYYDCEKPFAFTHHYNAHLDFNRSNSKLLFAQNPWNSAALKTCSPKGRGTHFGPNVHLGGGQDLVFFIDPEKNIGLVNQAKRLKIPTIGVISSGENKRGRMLFSSCSLDQSVHYPIIGNPVSCFFMHVLFDTLIRTLEKNKILN